MSSPSVEVYLGRILWAPLLILFFVMLTVTATRKLSVEKPKPITQKQIKDLEKVICPEKVGRKESHGLCL